MSFVCWLIILICRCLNVASWQNSPPSFRSCIVLCTWTEYLSTNVVKDDLRANGNTVSSQVACFAPTTTFGLTNSIYINRYCVQNI